MEVFILQVFDCKDINFFRDYKLYNKLLSIELYCIVQCFCRHETKNSKQWFALINPAVKQNEFKD